MASGSFIYVGKSRLRRKYRKQKIENRIKRKERRRQQREEAQRQEKISKGEKTKSGSNTNNKNNKDNNNIDNNQPESKSASSTYAEIEHHSCRFCEDVSYTDHDSFSSFESNDSEIIPLIGTNDSSQMTTVQHIMLWKTANIDKEHELDDNNNNSIKRCDVNKNDADKGKQEGDKLEDSPGNWEEVMLIDGNKVETDDYEDLISWDVSPNRKKKGCAPCCVIM